MSRAEEVEIGAIILSWRDGGWGGVDGEPSNPSPPSTHSFCPQQLDGIVYYKLVINLAWLTAHHYPLITGLPQFAPSSKRKEKKINKYIYIHVLNKTDKPTQGQTAQTLADALLTERLPCYLCE